MLNRRLSLIVVLALPCFILTAGAPPQTPSLPRPPFDAARARELQQEWAKSFGVDSQVTNGIGMKLVHMPGGQFTLGPNGSTYRVSLTQPFYLGATEVTLG